MPLTEVAIKSSKPREKPYKLADGLGMFLLINPNGSRLWRFKYRFGGKEKLLAIGSYPAVSLKQARDYRDAARQLLKDGKDPALERKLIKQNNRTTKDIIHRLEMLLIPLIPLSTICGDSASER